MQITKIQLTNFKRYTDLTIEQIPATSKLVLLIGANGSGKSCVFDAFNFCYILSAVYEIGISPDTRDNYYIKSNKNEASILMINSLEENIFSGTFRRNSNANYTGLFQKRESFYGRTSFRQLSELTNTIIGESNESKKPDIPIFFINKDNRIENDLALIYKSITKEIFRDDQGSKEIKEKYIHPINLALENVLGNSNGTKLRLLEIIPPFDGEIPQITFQKGAHQIHYNYLSAGEKEVFNILINLLSRSPQYQDTIYYIDELDLHLNTKLQFNLLKEITENWIPENCQLWTASHSLGFIEYARQSDHASIIDLMI